MKEVIGNIWNCNADYKCITVNGALRTDGTGIMGAGIALQAKKKYPDIEIVLGNHIKKNGLCVGILKYNLIAFPTKIHFKNRSTLRLIEKSARELEELRLTLPKGTTIALTRPGCLNGRLRWIHVKPIISNILSNDNFIVIDRFGGD